jgi:hypothetical protein
MGRAQVVIEDPILNSPYAVPARHFRFDVDGILNSRTQCQRRAGTVAGGSSR